MKATEQTMQQIERALKKVASKYPSTKEATVLTDIHLQVCPDSGELKAYDDDDEELTRCVISDWIDYKEENFYEDVQPIIREAIVSLKDQMENLSVLKPYSFVLINDEKETIADLYLVDDDTIIIDDELMKGLSDDLDKFLNTLLKS